MMEIVFENEPEIVENREAHKYFGLCSKDFKNQKRTIFECVLNPFPNDKFLLFQTEGVCRRQFQIY